MTINLFQVDEALKAEDEAQERLEKALAWKLRGWEAKPEETTVVEEVEEGGELPEVR